MGDIMKVLLDTNIVIHREADIATNKEIGHLYRWIDNLAYQKCIHPITIEEIGRLRSKAVLESMTVKLKSYNLLPITAKLDSKVLEVSKKHDSTQNDANDTALINEVYCDRVDILITEDRKIHQKARELAIDDRVFTIDAFLEKVTAEHPSLVEYKIPSVRKEYFGNIDLQEEFFDSFREDYATFEKWFRKKAHEIAYVGRAEGKIVAFLYLKVEDEKELYSDIQPIFSPKKRLKIGTFKVLLNGYKLGERFLKITFDNALHFGVEEIYITVFPRRVEQKRLVYLLQDFGYHRYGTKKSDSGDEEVYVRDFAKRASTASPKETYPFLSRKARKFIVPIYPEYHTNLFPDSILRTESPDDFIEQEPHRNAISKAYISRSYERDLRSGDIVVFYRTSGYYESVVTTIGIVENVIVNIKNIDQFKSLCKKRTVFSEKELEEQWNYKPRNHPFIVNFLYSYSFPKRPNLKRLIELGVIRDIYSAPRGFVQISEASFSKIIMESQTDESIIVD